MFRSLLGLLHNADPVLAVLYSCAANKLPRMESFQKELKHAYHRARFGVFCIPCKTPRSRRVRSRFSACCMWRRCSGIYQPRTICPPRQFPLEMHYPPISHPRPNPQAPSPSYVLSPFLMGRMFVREPSWEYSANLVLNWANLTSRT